MLVVDDDGDGIAGEALTDASHTDARVANKTPSAPFTQLLAQHPCKNSKAMTFND